MSRSIAEQTEQELGGPLSVLVRQRRDHVELDRLLQRLRASSGVDQDEVLTRVNRLVFAHAFAEETVLFPAVRRLVPGGEEVALRIEQAHQSIDESVSELDRTPPGDPRRAELVVRRTAPTRPHPVVARRPPGNVLSGLPLSVIDRGRDRLDRLARSRSDRWSARAATASRGLARVAGTVERRRVLQRGERPETRSPEAWSKQAESPEAGVPGAPRLGAGS